MLELRGITKRFGPTLAVKNLIFEVKQSEFVVLFGPAGAGKTTTLRLIAGITQPNYGEIFFKGDSLKDIPPERRNFSMVFENYALYSHLSVYENLAFPLRARKMSNDKIEKSVQEMAEVLQITPLLDRRPGYLSGGQRQRVALGRGLIRDAFLYLLDEPISHLDARLRIHMRAELKNICIQNQSTVIHVTHDYREALALADRVIVLNKGKIMQIGEPQKVFNNPANDFVAGFIGNPPMSFLEVEPTAQAGVPGYRIQRTSHFLPTANDTVLNQHKSDQNITLGLRANQTSLSREQDAFHNTPVEVYIAENQGHRNLVTVKVGDQLLQVVTAIDDVHEVGSKAWIGLHSQSMHVFVNGDAVLHPTEHLKAVAEN